MSQDATPDPNERGHDEVPGTVLSALDRLADRLLDTSARNRLVNYRLTSSLVLTSPAGDVLGDLLGDDGLSLVTEGGALSKAARGETGARGPGAAPARHLRNGPDGEALDASEVAGVLDATCTRLRRSQRAVAAERGIHVLHLAAGFLHWSDDRQDLLSPLLLLPVVLACDSRRRWRLEAVEDQLEVNPALRRRLGEPFAHALAAPPPLGDRDALAAFFDAVRDACTPDHPWQVSEDAAVGLVSFAKEVVYRDLTTNAEHIARHPIAAALLSAGAAGAVPEGTPAPELGPLPLPADASQRAALGAGVAGESFVLFGPPGTGKSQTIANLIAALAMRGQRTLFVTEKQAAIDAVVARLRDAGLDDLVLDLHNLGHDRGRVVRELVATAHEEAEPALEEESLDTFARAAAQLDAYGAALAEPRGRLGWSLEHLLAVALGHRRALEQRAVTFDRLAGAQLLELNGGEVVALEEAASRLGDHLGTLRWAELGSWRSAPLDELDRRGARQAVEEVRTGLELHREIVELASRVSERLGEPGRADLTRLDDIERLARLLEQRVRPLPAALGSDACSAGVLKDLQESRSELAQAEDALRALEARGHLLGRASWRELASQAARVLPGVLGELDRFGELVDGVLEESGPRLRGRAGALSDVAARLRDAVRALTLILTELDGSTPEVLPTLSEAQDLAGLVSLAASAPPVPPAWLEPGAEGRVRAALDTLRVAWEAEQAAAEEASRLFTAEVRDPSFADVLQRLEGRTRLGVLGEDRTLRRRVAAASRAGVYDNSLLESLDLARHWRAAAERRDAAERNARELVGEDTAWEDVAAALATLATAHDLAASQANPAQRLEVLGWARERLDALRPAADHLARLLRDLLTQAGPAAGISPAHLSSLPLSVAAELVAGAAHTVAALAETVGALEQRAGRELTPAALRQLSELEQRAGEAGARLDAAHSRLAPFYPALLSGDGAETRLIEADLSWLAAVHQLLGARPAPAVLRDTFEGLFGYRSLDELQHTISAWRKTRSELATLTGVAASELDRSGQELLQAFTVDVGLLEAWRHAVLARRRLAEVVGTAFVDELVASPVPPEAAVDVVFFSLCAAAIDEILAADDRLHGANAAELERARSMLAQSDREAARAVAPGRARAARARAWTMIGGRGHPAAKALERERHKSRRFRPVRSLLSDPGLAGAIGVLKPCLAMSPTTVSSLLPVDVHFDVVVFDEASQLLPEDALGAVVRADRLVVAGDERQLPPTPFFLPGDAGLEREEDAAPDDTDALESFLGLAAATPGIATFPLRWHYRSRHESLIAFANERFYSDVPMTIFPAASPTDGELGVVLHHVAGGCYERGTTRTNPLEAARVVEVVCHHLISRPGDDIGVVAFSRPQAELIAAQLAEAITNEGLADDPDDPLGGVFVKNLENVQGEDRDVIVLSVGYGRDRDGRLHANFGPLSRRDGWRRLNVATTRARRRMEVVSSIDAADIPDGLAGGAHLKAFLAYAAHPSAGVAGTETTREPESPLEEDVLDELRAAGHDGVCQVGVGAYRIDIAVRSPRNPARFVLGIECDGAAYHASADARERDHLRQEVLEDLGWRIHRVWGPSWFRDRRRELGRLLEAVSAALREDGAPGPPVEEAAPVPGPEAATITRSHGGDEAGRHDDRGPASPARPVPSERLEESGATDTGTGATGAGGTGAGATGQREPGDLLTDTSAPGSPDPGLDAHDGYVAGPGTGTPRPEAGAGDDELLELLVEVVEDNGRILALHAFEAAARRARFALPLARADRRRFVRATEVARAAGRVQVELPDGLSAVVDGYLAPAGPETT